MYSIGMFSQICRVTPKTLRHYDEIGLLRPARIDRFTGYRYYTTGQLPRMNQIQSLRQMGFSLTEIIALLDGGAGPETIRALLELKRGELAARIREDGQRLRLVENILRKGTLMMENYNVTIKELPEVIVAYLRTVIQSYDDLFHLMPEVLGPEMERLGCKCAEPEYCFNVYHYEEYRDHDIDVSLCQAVTERKEDSDVAKFQTVAPGAASGLPPPQGALQDPAERLHLRRPMDRAERLPARRPAARELHRRHLEQGERGGLAHRTAVPRGKGRMIRSARAARDGQKETGARRDGQPSPPGSSASRYRSIRSGFSRKARVRR